MFSRRMFIIFLTVMLLIAALGFWVMIEGAATYQNRPVIDDFARPQQSVSRMIELSTFLNHSWCLCGSFAPSRYLVRSS